ncbi:HAMP domain-containing sensor histidine kinase [uncultured Xylophilus sp.]|uniref:sensor histidine kinase n=1 Tax=uncultured Xylophilus sp. TaxID=296832 RepID=UPI0025E11518|nr:HAMP domain-containing sensor histidine kinase [uncultured Xylophilus sp.]
MTPPAVRRPGTLARRLTRTLVLCVAAVWALSLVGAVGFVHREINRNFDQELEESALRLLDVATHNLDLAGLPARGAPPVLEPPPLVSGDTLLYRLVDTEGQTLLVPTVALHSHIFDPVPPVPGFRNHAGWRIYTVRHPLRPLLLQLADPRSERRQAVRVFMLGLALPMLAVLGLLALVVSAAARGELRVLHRLEAEIAVRGGDDLRPLALAGMPRELQSVGEHVNRLLERLAQALDVERALAANAAHELRTPLAAVRLRLQTALEGSLAASDIEAAVRSLDVLRHRTEKLLQLSRAESAAVLAQVPVDLVRLAATVAEEFWQTPALQQRLQLRVPDAPLPPVRGDVDALAIALRNLVENALRYGGDGRIDLAVRGAGVVAVRDHGPGVAPARLDALRQRHVRDSDAQAGYGLGLSIVATIVQRHQGRLALVSPLPDGTPGFEARIELPLAENAAPA